MVNLTILAQPTRFELWDDDGPMLSSRSLGALVDLALEMMSLDGSVFRRLRIDVNGSPLVVASRTDGVFDVDHPSRTSFTGAPTAIRTVLLDIFATDPALTSDVRAAIATKRPSEPPPSA